jgi:flagellar M-ring protein FliF
VTPRGTTDTEYDYGRRVEQVVAAPGGVTRLSIGVIVPGNMDLATQQRIEDLVRVAAGLNETRGDVVVVQNLDGIGSEGVVAIPAAADPLAFIDAAVPAVAPAAAAAAATPARWQPWYPWAGGAALLLIIVMVSVLRRGATDARLSEDERARLLADVKASLAGRAA